MSQSKIISVMHSTDGGRTWTKLMVEPASAIARRLSLNGGSYDDGAGNLYYRKNRLFLDAASETCRGCGVRPGLPHFEECILQLGGLPYGGRTA